MNIEITNFKIIDNDQMFHLYCCYVEEYSAYLVKYGKTSDPPTAWWLNDEDCLVSTLRIDNFLQGFVITGKGARVDRDVDSEILEIYVDINYRKLGLGQKLAVRGVSLLHGKMGFTVFMDNLFARKFWNSFLEKQNIPFHTYDTSENGIPVLKYRFVR